LNFEKNPVNNNLNNNLKEDKKNMVEYSYFTDDKLEVFIFPKSLHHNFSMLYTNTSIKITFTAKKKK
jgi:hypothetical protein